jgi:shikimate dehydrogenase
MHNAAFRALGLDFAYVPFRVAPAALADAIGGVRALGVAGLNVTVPHKERIVPLLDSLTGTARAIGAVNTVLRGDGTELVGDNTDAPGFRAAIAAARVRLRGRTVLVLGAGGSARAVVHALAQSAVARIVVLNRTPGRADGLRDLVPKTVAFETGRLDAALDRTVARDASLVVNCTSLGLDGRSAPALAIDALPRDAFVYDLVYGARTTPLVRAARRRRRRAEDGRSMLLHQAALAFRLWTGRRAPLAVMNRALGRRH